MVLACESRLRDAQAYDHLSAQLIRAAQAPSAATVRHSGPGPGRRPEAGQWPASPATAHLAAGPDYVIVVAASDWLQDRFPDAAASRGGVIGRTLDRERSHLQPGHRSLAMPVNQSQLWLVQQHAQPGQQTPGLLHGEGQVPSRNSTRSWCAPHPVHPQRRVNPAGHNQLQRRHVILHQPARGVGAGRAGQVKVINDQYLHPFRRVKVVSQGSDCIG